MLAKAAYASVCDAAGVYDRRLARRDGRQVAILMYHRVAPFAELPRWVEAGMVVEPRTFECHLAYLKQRFEIVPLCDLASGPSEVPSKPRCVLTFDDGWADFVTYAYPILRAHRLPATVFLPTDYIGTERWFWTDRLGCMLDVLDRSARASVVKQAGDPLLDEIAGYTGSFASKLGRAIALLKPHGVARIEELLGALAGMVGGKGGPAGRAFMTWSEVDELRAEGLVAFGSHTAAHPILTTVSDEETAVELQRSLDALVQRRAVDRAFVPFCYPNGGTSPRIRDLVRQCGYHLAVTTRLGWNGSSDDPFLFKRIGLHEDISSSQALLALRLTGRLMSPWAMQTRSG